LQVHGLNLLSAISLLAEVGDINLFDMSKQLFSSRDTQQTSAPENNLCNASAGSLR
jgi:transcriptional regulator of acetoin/glycerol metabolism